MSTKKINLLTNKKWEVGLTEPDWRKIFEVQLNIHMIDEYLTLEEKNENKNKVQKRLSQTKVPPKQFQNVYEKPPHLPFFFFIRGLYFKFGIGLTRPDHFKAFDIFLQGFEHNQCALCAYQLAINYSVKRNMIGMKEKAMFFLVMASALMEMQYPNVCDIRGEMIRVIDTYEEGVRLGEILISKYFKQFFSEESKNLYLLMFEFQYFSYMQGQERYQQLLQLLDTRIRSLNDHIALIYLFQIFSQPISVADKNIKMIIETALMCSKECFKAALIQIQKVVVTLISTSRDTIVFSNIRLIFFEIYNFLKFFRRNEPHDLWPLIFTINETLYQKKNVLLRDSLHFSLILRIRSEMLEKGLGQIPNIQLALDTILEELAMPKESDNLYAYANYLTAKLKRKLQQYSEKEVNEHFEKSFIQFTQRLSIQGRQGQITDLVYLYYLGRISKLWKQNILDTQNRFKEGLQLYIFERQKYKNVRTLQYEIICIKIEKKTKNQGRASLFFGNGIPQVPFDHSVQQSRKLDNTSQNKIQTGLQNSFQLPNQSNIGIDISHSIQHSREHSRDQIGSGSGGKCTMDLQSPLQNQNVSQIQQSQSQFKLNQQSPQISKELAELNMVDNSKILPDQISNSQREGKDNDQQLNNRIKMKNSNSTSPNNEHQIDLKQSQTHQNQHQPYKNIFSSQQNTSNVQLKDRKSILTNQNSSNLNQQNSINQINQNAQFSHNNLNYIDNSGNFQDNSSRIQSPKSHSGGQNSISSISQINQGQNRYLGAGFPQFPIDSRIETKIMQISQYKNFYDPKSIIVLDLLHRGTQCTTSEGVVVTNKQNDSINLTNISLKSFTAEISMVTLDRLQKLRSYKKHMNTNPDDNIILEGEPIIIKHFTFTDFKLFEDFLNHIVEQEQKLSTSSEFVIQLISQIKIDNEG